MKPNSAAAMNVQSRSKLGALLTIMVIGNFYYYKSWSSEETLDAHSSHESKNQLKLIKLIVPPSGNCSLPSQWGHAFHYVTDSTTGMTSLFLQNPRSSLQHAGISRQDVNISILHVDPAGLVNSEIILHTYAISNYACEHPTKQMDNRLTKNNSLRDQIDKLIKNIIRTNDNCQKYDLKQFKSGNRRNNYLLVTSNCVQNLIDTFQDSHIEEKILNCRDNQTLHFQALLKFLSRSQNNSNSYISTAIDNHSNLSDFYYGKINLTKLILVSHNYNYSLANSKENKSTSNLLTTLELSNLTKNNKEGRDKGTTRNYNTTSNNVIYLKNDLMSANLSTSKRNESINESSKKEKDMTTPQQLLNSDRALNIKKAETNTSNITASDQKHKSFVIQKNTNRSIENMNMIFNIEEKLDQKALLNDSARNYTVNNSIISHNEKEKENQSSKERKSKIHQGKDKRNFIGKTNNGLDTILIFKNLKEIDDLYDRTFSDPMLNSSITEISNRAATVAENNKDTHILESKSFTKNIVPENQNDSSINAIKNNFITTNKIQSHDYSLKPNSTTGMIASSTKKYKIIPSEETKKDEAIKIKAFITLPPESTKTVTKQFLYERNFTRHNQSIKNENNETTPELIIRTAEAKKQPIVDLFRSLSKESETNTIKQIESVKEQPAVDLFRSLSQESKKTTIKPKEVVKIFNKTSTAIPLTSKKAIANDRLDYLTQDFKEDENMIIENCVNNQTQNKATKLSIKTCFSNSKEDLMDTKAKDNIDENTRLIKKIFDPTSTSTYLKSDTHISELSSKTSKLFDQSEVVHKTHYLYDSKPQVKIFRSYANTMSSSNSDKHKGIGEYLINKYQADDDGGRSVGQDITNFAALVSPRDQSIQDLPYENPSNINVSYNVVTYIPENDEYEYGTGNVEDPPNIQTYKPIILNDSSFTFNSSEKQYTETPKDTETTYYNDYPEKTPSYDDYTPYTNTQVNSNSNPNVEYIDNYENTELPKNDYSEVSTPKNLEYTELPLVFSTTDNSKENIFPAIETNANFENTDYSSNEGSKGNSINIHSGEIVDGFRDTKDTYNDDYSAYTEPSGPYSNVPVSTEDGPTNEPFYDNPEYSKITKPISLYAYSNEINDHYHVPKDYYNNQAQQPPQAHHSISAGLNPVLENPMEHLNLDHHKPTSYVVYQNFLTKTNQFLKNKLPPDKTSVPPYSTKNGGYSNIFSGSEEQLVSNEYRDKNVRSKNKPSEETTISPKEIINNFLNSPINWKEFEQTSDFNFDTQVKNSEMANDNKQVYQLEYTSKENLHPVLYNTVSNPLLNKSIVNPDLSYPLNNTHYEVNVNNVPKLPNYVQSVGLGDLNSFQPLILGHKPDGMRSTPYPLINNTNLINLNYTLPSLSFNVDQLGPTTNLLNGFQNNLIDFNALGQKVHDLQPGKLLSFRDYHQPLIQEIAPTKSQISKGIDIFIPPKIEMKPITRSIDILTPGKNPRINIIKLKPLHHKSTQFQHFEKKPLEIDIFTREKSNTQSMYYPVYPPVHPTRTVDPVINGINHLQHAPSMKTLHFPYIPGFQHVQPTFEDTFKPLDLSMDAGHVNPTIKFSEIFKNMSNSGEQFLNSTKEKQRKDSTTSENPTNFPLNSTKEHPGEHESWHPPNFTEPAMISFEKFNTEQEINSYLTHINRFYGHKVKVSTIGTTVEGRPIQAVKLYMGGGGHNPVIVMDGGIHAREWIAPAVVLYVVQQLAERPELFPLLRRVDWLLVPLLNPDGYVYSMTKDRLWRKNRARPKPTDTHRCYGVDLNRNFGVFRSRRHIDWDSRGTSDDPCASNYRGVTPFSEPESRALRDLIWEHRGRVKLYVSFHSYGNYLMFPWGYKRPHPNDWKELDELATAARGAIFNATGTRYSIGSTADIMGVNSGGSDDWVKGYVGVKYCYTVELPGGGAHGFDLPPSRIRPVVEEIFQGIQVFAKFIEREFSP